MGDDWDGHRGQGHDDDQQIEASPEERFGEPSTWKEGHDLVVFEMKRISHKVRTLYREADNLAPIPRVAVICSSRLCNADGLQCNGRYWRKVQGLGPETTATSSSEGRESGKLELEGKI